MTITPKNVFALLLFAISVSLGPAVIEVAAQDEPDCAITCGYNQTYFTTRPGYCSWAPPYNSGTCYHRNCGTGRCQPPSTGIYCTNGRPFTSESCIWPTPPCGCESHP